MSEKVATGWGQALVLVGEVHTDEYTTVPTRLLSPIIFDMIRTYGSNVASSTIK